MNTPQLSMGIPTFSKEEPASWKPLFERAHLLEEAGVDRLLVSDHVVFGEDLDAYARPELGGAVGGVQPTGPDGLWLEPITTLAVLTGVTTRIRLGTNILLAALRRPVVLAKSAATLDVLSEGRLDLGVGVGWQCAEYEAAGLDFHRRGHLLDHTLEVCQTLWRDRTASYESDDLTFDRIHQQPKPCQAGGVPLWISGTVNPKVAHRIARFGSGWIPWGPDAADLTASLPRMQAALRGFGRDPDGLQVADQLVVARQSNGELDLDRTIATVGQRVAAGVTDFRIQMRLPDDHGQAADQLGEVVAAFRRATNTVQTEAQPQTTTGG